MKNQSVALPLIYAIFQALFSGPLLAAPVQVDSLDPTNRKYVNDFCQYHPRSSLCFFTPNPPVRHISRPGGDNDAGNVGGEEPLPPVGSWALPDPKLPWSGINPIHGGMLNKAEILSNSLKGIRELGLWMARVGVNHPLDKQEQIYEAFLAKGIVIHGVFPVEGKSPDQFRTFVNATMQRFKGKVFYYIVGNEPDRNGITPAQAVQYTRIAFEESRKVAPDGSIRIESSPTSAPGIQYLKSMIDLGVTRYADVVGVHSYGTQISDNHKVGIRRPWEYIAAANKSYGYPVRPVASSENGTATGYAPRGLDGRVYQARWFNQNYVQHKRFGYDNVLLYALDSSYPREEYDIATMCGADLCRHQPTFNTIAARYQERPFANGGFEEPNNREVDWVIIYDTGQLNPVEWTRVSFIRNDAANAHSGGGYMRANAFSQVRRVAERLNPGTPVTITAWVKNTGNIKLKALGYDSLDGDAETVAASGPNKEWKELSITVTPRRTWVVISMETESGSAIWDDVSIK